MPRVVSFVVLLAIVLLVAAVFFRVMATFLVPLFLACVLLVMFQPLHRWMLERLPTRPRIAALLTTFVILLIVLLPSIWLGWKAYFECRAVYIMLQEGGANQLAQRLEDPTEWLSDRHLQLTGEPLDTDHLLREATTWIGNAVLRGVQAIPGVLIGLAIMVISLYYFLADGPAMVRGLMRLSPLDDTYERELLLHFGAVSRAVVVATLLAAVVQGALGGVGYYFALPSTAPIFLLTALTMVLAIVPFVGAAGMWVPICLWLFFYGENAAAGEAVNGGNAVRAIALAIYCLVIVTPADNIIKPLVLHGQSNLHPLLALLSILGGVQVLGPVGILVGPMLVSFLQALLNMLHKEIEAWGKASDAASNAI